MRRLVVVASALCLVACAGGRTPAASWQLCREVAADVGLRFDNPYGAVVAEADMGIAMQRNMGNGAAVGDYDNDGDLDVYVLGQEGTSSRLFRNELTESGSAQFVDVTDSAGVADTGLGRAAHLADFDGDGWLDLLVANDTDPGAVTLSRSRLFRNKGNGSFVDVTEGSGFDPEGFLVGGVALADFDSDHDLDIYMSYWTRELAGSPIGGEIVGVWPGSNRYFENLGNFRFRDSTNDVGLGGVSIDTFTAVPHDFDGDRDLDMYLAVDHRADRFYEQVDGRFRDVSTDVGVFHRGNDMGVAGADIDGNGTIDLFVSNIFDPQQSYGVDPPGNTLLMVSSEGTLRFTDEADERGVLATGWSWGAAFVDADLDADLDLFVVQGFDEFIADNFDLDDASATLLMNEGGVFTEAVDTGCDVPGDQRTLIPFDFDRDGDADLLVTQIDHPLLLLENRSEGNTLTVALDPADPAGASAVAEVATDDWTTRQLILDGGSYLAGSPGEAYFGLGSATAADVTVRWSTGETTVHEQVPAGTFLAVERSQSR